MGSSSGGDDPFPPPSNPETPTPGLQPVAQVQPQAPIQYPEFLPSQPGAMATGLTPAHFAAIAGMDAPPPAPPGGGATTPAAAIDPEAQRAALAKAMALQQEINGMSPMNRPGGRLPFNAESGAFERNPDFDPIHRAGMRASSPGWGGSLAGKLA